MRKYIINNINNISFDSREKADQHAEEVLKLKSYIVKNQSGQEWEYVITETGYKYRLTSTEHSSEKYGKCECCKKHTSEVFLQTESKYFKHEHNGETFEGWTEHQCKSYFGHKECLAAKRR